MKKGIIIKAIKLPEYKDSEVFEIYINGGISIRVGLEKRNLSYIKDKSRQDEIIKGMIFHTIIDNIDLEIK